MLRVLDIFSGIGGFSLGLERTGGFRTVAFCEIDGQARRVLAKHWPGVMQFDDVRWLSKGWFDLFVGEPIDVICGGFPCQDISLAGLGAGLSGERSGLWFEYLRLIYEFRPAYAIIENVALLRSRGLDKVLWSLAEIGYSAEWHCIPASAVGAPHPRDRVWIVAYPNNERKPAGTFHDEAPLLSTLGAVGGWSWRAGFAGNVRMADGLPGGMDRLRQLGNAVVPQIPEMIGRAILAERYFEEFFSDG